MKSFEINDFRPLTLDCFACALISYIGILAYYLIGTLEYWHIVC